MSLIPSEWSFRVKLVAIGFILFTLIFTAAKCDEHRKLWHQDARNSVSGGTPG